MQDFRKIRVWQANRQLTVMVYRVTAGYPATERYGLTAQMRSAAVSIGSNLAEGCGRGTAADTRRFWQMAFSSAVELLHQLITSLDLGFITLDQFSELEGKLEPIRRGIAGLMRRLREGS